MTKFTNTENEVDDSMTANNLDFVRTYVVIQIIALPHIYQMQAIWEYDENTTANTLVHYGYDNIKFNIVSRTQDRYATF